MNSNGPQYAEPRQTVLDQISEDEIEDIEERRVANLEEWQIDESAVIAEIHKNSGNWTAYFQENNTKGKQDLEFYYRDQWTSIERSEFDRTFTPALVVNKIYDPIRKIIGEQRENTPQLKVRSVTGKASQESLDLISDMLKRIAYSSNSKVVYQEAFQSAMLFSYGAFLVDVDYESPDSFYQDIMYRWIPEPEKCFWDPSAMTSHKGDGNFCGHRYSITNEEYDARYSNVPHPTSFTDPDSLTQFQWYSEENVILCEYWIKEWYTKTILKLGDDSIVTQQEWEEIKKSDEYKDAMKHKKSAEKTVKGMAGEDIDPEISDQFIMGMIPAKFEVVDERTTEDYIIMHYRCTADKILEFEEWPSRFLPLIFVAGDTYYEQGQQYTRSFLNQAKDTQRTINYLASNIAGQLKNSSRGQWLGTPANVMGPGMEYQWQNPETQQGILLANPDPKKGGDPMPTKVPPAEIAQSLFVHYERVSNDLKEVLGVYDTQLGGPGSAAESNKTVLNRMKQGMGSAKVFFDNLDRAVEQAGKVSLDMFPAVYNTERTITLTRGNGTQYTTTINQEMPDGSMKNLIEKGDFDVELDAAPNFAVQKQQAVETLIQLAAADPQGRILPLIGDFIAKNMDLEFSQLIADRLQTLVPPAVLAKEEGKPPPPPQPNPMEQKMQMDMQIQAAKMEDQKHQQQIREQKLEIDRQKAQLQKAELLFKMQQLQHDMRIAEMRDGTENTRAQLNFSAQMAKIIADMENNNESRESA